MPQRRIEQEQVEEGQRHGEAGLDHQALDGAHGRAFADQAVETEGRREHERNPGEFALGHGQPYDPERGESDRDGL